MTEQCSLCDTGAENFFEFKIGMLDFQLCEFCLNGMTDCLEDLKGECMHCGKKPYQEDKGE